MNVFLNDRFTLFHTRKVEDVREIECLFWLVLIGL